MSSTQMLTTNANTVEQFSKKVFVEMFKPTSFTAMVMSDAIYQAPELTSSGKGDRITIPLVNILRGIGTSGTLIGKEEALDIESFQMTTGLFRHAVLNPNSDTIEQHRTNIDFARVSEKLIPEFHASRLDASAFNAAAGITSTTITVDGVSYSGSNRLFVQGLNTPTAPTTNRITRAGGASTDQALTSSNTMTLDLVDDVLVSVQNTYPAIKPLKNGRYALFMSHEQARDLQRDSSGQIQFYNLALAEIQGGKETIFNRKTANGPDVPWGYYKNVDFYISTRVANGENSSSKAEITTVSRAVLMGENALVYGSTFGTINGTGNAGGVGTVPLRITSQLQDYGYYKGIEGRMLYGLAKPVQDGEDLGVHVISTYAA